MNYEDSERKETDGCVLLYENSVRSLFDNLFSVAKKWVGIYHVVSKFFLNFTYNFFFLATCKFLQNRNCNSLSSVPSYFYNLPSIRGCK
jgi:hypothetical protein